MATAAVTTEYCNLSLQELRESPTNPRQRFEENALKELAESIDLYCKVAKQILL